MLVIMNIKKHRKQSFAIIKTAVLTLFVLFSFLNSVAQERLKPYLLGINPSTTIEPYYNDKEFDVNILPLVLQKPVASRLDIRMTTILNYGIRNTQNAISHFGFEGAMPIYSKKRDPELNFSKGFYVAPIVGLTRNRNEKNNNLGLWIEPGHSFLFEKKLALTIGIQLGATYFYNDLLPNRWGNHFGIKVIFGRWM